jgi:hypothetical protein
MKDWRVGICMPLFQVFKRAWACSEFFNGTWMQLGGGDVVICLFFSKNNKKNKDGEAKDRHMPIPSNSF